MKKNKKLNMTNKLISIIFTTFILFSCYSKTNSSNKKIYTITPKLALTAIFTIKIVNKLQKN
jgi:hypothetical protein